MRRALALIPVLLIALTAPIVSADDRRTDPATLTIMTFNAANLWDGVEPEDGQLKFAHKHSPKKAAAHMARIAKIIRRHNPDIVNLVEVEGLIALATFNDRFLTGLGYKPYLAQGRDTFTGQDVGLLTRIDPLTMVRDDRMGASGKIEKNVSKNYVARFEINGRRIAIIGLHFLAHPLDRWRKHKRQAQADAVWQMAIDLQCDGFEIVVLGDFNDFDGDTPDHVHSKPLTDVLKRIKRMVAGDVTDDLVNAAERIPRDRRYTAWWDMDEDGLVDEPHELTSIDHVLLSPSLAKCIERSAIDTTHDLRAVSDHFPVIVRLRFAPVGAVGNALPGAVRGTPYPEPTSRSQARQSRVSLALQSLPSPFPTTLKGCLERPETLITPGSGFGEQVSGRTIRIRLRPRFRPSPLRPQLCEHPT